MNPTFGVPVVWLPYGPVWMFDPPRITVADSDAPICYTATVPTKP